MKIKATLSLLRENSKLYMSKLAKFEVKIMKMTIKKIKNAFFADKILYYPRTELYGHNSLV